MPHERHSTVKHMLLHPRRQPRKSLEALRDVSFDIGAGEFVGIVGRNGSGKSTLLRCLSGIYGVDGGTLDVRGRVAPFIELGVGFHPEMSARDNVVVNAVMLGMSPREARARFDEIIDFAELRDFKDVKLKNYSSGMVIRLAFAVTVQVDADILLFDEVLAVGDAQFRDKCHARFQEMKDDGRTVLLVTHEMELVERFCDRALLLECGELRADGRPAAVADFYEQMNRAGADGLERPSFAGAVRALWFERADGEQVEAAAQGEVTSACVSAAIEEPVQDPVIEVELRDCEQRLVFSSSSRSAHGPTGSFDECDSIVVRFPFENRLTPGRYTLAASVTAEDGRLLARSAETAALRVHAARGVVDLRHEFKVARQ